MSSTLVEQLAAFATGVDPASLPPEVVSESKRILLDSLGCAVASLGEPGADAGVRYARLLGGSGGPASILGTGLRTSEVGAAFANAELINALDQDAILPPGHVTPYVLPGALAAAEGAGTPGARLLTAIAVAHELSFRFGKATDYLREIVDGAVRIPPVVGYGSTIFGGTAAVSLVRGQSSSVMASALGLAGSTTPVNAQRSWIAHAPPTTIKYQQAGGLATAAMTAAYLAEFGHRGDLRILDDREFGWPRFIGTSRWEPDKITESLGVDWLFPASQSFKPYPHCRILHTLLDAVTDIVTTNDLKPDEIESIAAWGENWVFEPLWLNNEIGHVRDAQFSMAHGLALSAHRVPAGNRWQQENVVRDPSVLSLMQKVTYEAHPDFDRAFAANPLARPSRLEITARGKVFRQDRDYPKGSPSADPSTRMTDAQLAAKFRNNTADILTSADADHVVDLVFSIEDLSDVRTLTANLRPRVG